MSNTYAAAKAPAKIKKLTAERETLRAEIADLAKRVAEIDEVLGSLEPATVFDAGDYDILRRPARRFNATAFAAAFPATKRPKLYKKVLDTDAVKRSFSAVELEKFQDTSYSLIVTPKKR